MKAYNIPKEELRIEADDGDVLVSITPEKAFIKNLEGGGGDIEVKPLTVTENGTYTAPEGDAYSPVTVNVSGGTAPTPVSKVLNIRIKDNIADTGHVGGILIPSWVNNRLYNKLYSGDWVDNTTEFSTDACTLYPIKLIWVHQLYELDTTQGCVRSFSTTTLESNVPGVVDNQGNSNIAGYGLDAIYLTDEYDGQMITLVAVDG